ncbi:glycosyl transferase family protein [Novosphingobium lentum]|uniref:glycosyl transferase family protein n=1 Tax=Novosphingobium lentum TaxID=145287 RepID=UPI000830DF92|nr:glycosyl transferase family protein [Novosphingobium lentum]
MKASVLTLQWLDVVEGELLLFAAVWFAIGALDELIIDILWLWLRLTGRAGSQLLDLDPASALRGVAAVLVPAWQESAVVGAMLDHALRSWPQDRLRIYAGCYRNDPATLEAMIAVARDRRLRIVIHDCDGPTTKADCLNRLYAALCEDERRSGFRARCVILQDAEDMVHPAALAVMDRGLDGADFVQLPVCPEPQARSRWIAGHYADEFAEAHAKAMVVRDWLGAGLPAAGVGCAFSRAAIEQIAARRGSDQPFAADCLTEDYECGLLIGEIGGASRFVRLRDASGALVGTREFFPGDLAASVRQKTRWMHGIAFQGWDHLGWHGRPVDLWMRMRDRRGPLTAIVLTVGYVLVVLWPLLALAQWLGWYEPRLLSPGLRALLAFNFATLLWRMAMRFSFTTREYGWREGLRSVPRVPIGNAIAIIAGRRAVWAYLAAIRSGSVRWDKTAHGVHPSLASAAA